MSPSLIDFGTDLVLTFRYDDDTPLSLVSIRPAIGPAHADPATVPAVPFVEVLTVADGRRPGYRYSETLVGSRLRYVSHQATGTDLRITQNDPVTGLIVTSVIIATPGRGAFRSWTEVELPGPGEVLLQAVTSFATGAFLTDSGVELSALDLLTAESDWVVENRWQRRPVRDLQLVDINTDAHSHSPRSRIGVTAHSSWSTGERLPIGVVAARDGGYALGWQIEHNGPWHFEVAENLTGAYLALLGPTDLEHGCLVLVDNTHPFTSVPVSVACVDGTADDAFAALTWQRRALLRDHPQNATLPLIFNDYMNTLMGDPTTEKLLPLIDAAAQAGAEYFCIDAGWYDDGGYWWNSVGEWKPSTNRFPGGLGEVIDRIRSHQMVPGLWLEPEVVGVESPVADRLPTDAFLQRHGTRIVDHERYLLDLRHPAARAHLDEVVDRLVGEFTVGYFKLDYNVTPGLGTDLDAVSPGAGLLAHNRALLSWLDGVLDRHPDLILENCGSGAMRQDYAMLSRLALQSTSDQMDPLLYATIAAAAPAAVLPEQAANWAYPQPGMNDEEIVLTMVNGIAGRLYLSGHLAQMSPSQLALVTAGVEAHKDLRAALPTTEPFWPLGLPAWTAPVVCVGLRGADATYLSVWKRSEGERTIELPLTEHRGHHLRLAEHFPSADTPVQDRHDWTFDWDPETAVLRIGVGASAPSARVLSLIPSPGRTDTGQPA
ncbi:hypothetical protein GCM10009841_14910 [Microlunatus panaciterrae]|uniref:Alpha-galactosidase n=1 Tax=Microlunatus panaciterrae TaxID=400768 RepID=A0ABS2RM10_9ACTN|nr:glycoside hydrolase family 36 protein [Microlunatus panaciterrae]MBM7800051.1 alpha-galactosidase [Microlunatus panaciterrae]